MSQQPVPAGKPSTAARKWTRVIVPIITALIAAAAAVYVNNTMQNSTPAIQSGTTNAENHNIGDAFNNSGGGDNVKGNKTENKYIYNDSSGGDGDSSGSQPTIISNGQQGGQVIGKVENHNR